MKTKTYKTPEEEVDAWRRILWNKIKHMNWPQRAEYLNRRSAEIEANMKPLSPAYHARQAAYVKRVAAEYRASRQKQESV